ncbi:MAG: hypothetical protein EXQ56_06015 [Acidobacteria bacterium]|nr:hypothetical protein [Acidobacteriota bacterium]
MAAIAMLPALCAVVCQAQTAAENGVSYSVDISATPRAIQAGKKVLLEFAVRKLTGGQFSGRIVTDFQLSHTHLFHSYIVSQDLRFFLHEHPGLSPDGKFRIEATLPSPGLYRILSEFQPEGAPEQSVIGSLIVTGAEQPIPALTRDNSPKQADGLRVAMRSEPAQPNPSGKTLLFFTLDPQAGLENFHGDRGQMLVASDDLIDLMHIEPFAGAKGTEVQFNVYFPRPHNYRVWVEVQARGVVSRARFDVPVQEMK